MKNTSLLCESAACVVESIWGIGLCKVTDMVAEHGPVPAAGSIPGEKVTLQKIWEKLCSLEGEVRGKAVGEEARSTSEVLDARQKLKTLEELEKKEEDVWEAASEDLEGAISTGTPIRGRITKWFMEKGFGFTEVAGKTICCHVSAIRGGTGMDHLCFWESKLW